MKDQGYKEEEKLVGTIGQRQQEVTHLQVTRINVH